MSKNPFFWAILTAIVWGIVPILEKIGLSKISPNTGLLVRSLGVILGASVLLLYNFNSLKIELSSITQQSLFFLIISGVLASIVGQMFFYRALKFGEASKVVPLAAIYPLVSFLLALLFLGERFTVTKLFGISFVLLGVAFLR